MNNEKNLELFLLELAELTKKYNLEISGCGCCGSPYVTNPKGDFEVTLLEYEDGKYSVNYDKERY